jgi:hypothetical protein
LFVARELIARVFAHSKELGFRAITFGFRMIC